jgi:hypothetical protein
MGLPHAHLAFPDPNTGVTCPTAAPITYLPDVFIKACPDCGATPRCEDDHVHLPAQYPPKAPITAAVTFKGVPAGPASNTRSGPTLEHL